MKNATLTRRKFFNRVSKICAGFMIPFTFYSPLSSSMFCQREHVLTDASPSREILDKLPRISIVGIGNAGGNAINKMIDYGLQRVNFVLISTDYKELNHLKSPFKIFIGEGVGTNGDPKKGERAAFINQNKIKNALINSHMVFIVSGLGGGTGTGASPVIADLCKELGSLTVSVVSMPFSYEGKKRNLYAAEGINALCVASDLVISIPNDFALGLLPQKAKILDAFNKSDDLMFDAVRCITDLIQLDGLVGIDFSDFKSVIPNSGLAGIGVGSANGRHRAINATKKALCHPIIKDYPLAEAKTVIMNITADADLTFGEMTQAADLIHNKAGDFTEIIWGAIIDEKLNDVFNVTMLVSIV